MFEVRLMNEYFHGPIWLDPSVVDDAKLAPQEQYDRIRKDPILSKLNQEAGDLFDEYLDWSDPGNSPVELERERHPRMLQLMRAIRVRLHELSDGSFWVHDCEVGTQYCDIDWDHPDAPDAPEYFIVPEPLRYDDDLENLAEERKNGELKAARQRAYFDHHR